MRGLVLVMSCIAFVVLGGLIGVYALDLWDDGDDSSESAAQPTTTAAPSLFTNANGEDVWARPGYHLGARVQVQGKVLATRQGQDGNIVAIVIDQYPVALYIFDQNFKVARGDRIEVIGDVRGPLGGELTLGIPQFGPLSEGVAVIDAAQARQLKQGQPSG